MADLSAHNSVQPITANERVFGFRDQTALWFSLGVGLLVMQAGASLVPGLSPPAALFATLIGSIVGAAILALAAGLGQETGLSAAGIMRASFGSSLGRLPALANVIQLVGWAAFEIIIMRDGSKAVLKQAFGLESDALSLILLFVWGGVLTLLLLGSMTTLVRQILSKIGLPLVVLSMIWLSYQFGSTMMTKGFSSFWGQDGSGDLSFWGGVDLVIAMPVSWLPLVADYSRFSKTLSGARNGTFIGYALANIWCYALGAIVAFAGVGDDLVTGLLLAQGGLVALSFIVIDELDNGYGDLYSASVSSQAIGGGASLTTRSIGMAILSIALALLLSEMAESTSQLISQFLTILSSIFVPLFGVILARYGAIKALGNRASEGAIAWRSLIAWIIGIAVYQGTTLYAPSLGSALPSLIVSFALAKLIANQKA